MVRICSSTCVNASCIRLAFIASVILVQDMYCSSLAFSHGLPNFISANHGANTDSTHASLFASALHPSSTALSSSSSSSPSSQSCLNSNRKHSATSCILTHGQHGITPIISACAHRTTPKSFSSLTCLATLSADTATEESAWVPSSFDKDVGICQGIKNDINRRWKFYKSDWKDGLHKKSLAAIVFLYLTCLAPTVAFGGMGNLITNGQMGVVEFLMSCGLSGIIYALFSGQPMTFVGPTGLVRICRSTGLIIRFIVNYFIKLI